MTLAFSPASITPLKAGDKAPNTKLTNTDNTEVALLELLDNKPTVLVFYRGSW